MLRYRVAVMIWLFMLLGMALRGLDTAGWDMLPAVVVLGSAYVAATSVNDIADEAIDRINHPGDRERPLLTGRATRGDLWTVHAVAAGIAVVASAPLGPEAAGIAVGSLAVGWAYSLPPVRLSHRTYLAPVALAVAYVLVPYAIGVEVAGGRWRATDVLLAGALCLLFASRIVLKDFRDRSGDAAHGKPTLLLRFGKGSTCLVSVVLLLAGNVALVAAIRPSPGLLTLIELFVASIGSRLYALWAADDARVEQVAIGLGARLGNGLLATVLGWMALSAEGAPEADRLLFATSVAVVFAAAFLVLVARPERAVIGYKG
jgi:4-hydroxybenzoate polyprenyltransferase